MSKDIFEQNNKFINPDLFTSDRTLFVLKSESIPPHLRSLLEKYIFRRCTIEEIKNSSFLTDNAWPGLPETTNLDFIARDMVNSPVGGVFDELGNMAGYTRLLYGYDNLGNPEILSHMTAVTDSVRDKGIGEALKWLARQIAFESTKQPINQLIVTFDNLQAKNCHVNMNKLGIICGHAGGIFKANAYGELTGKQHLGNPTDRYLGRWYLDSDWTLAHLEEKVKALSLEEIKYISPVIDFDFKKYRSPDTVSFPIPTIIHEDIVTPYLTIPIPSDWDTLLANDKYQNYQVANLWRTTTRQVIQNYHRKGYTTIAQIKDKEQGVDFQLMSLNFNPYNPPKELLR